MTKTFVVPEYHNITPSWHSSLHGVNGFMYKYWSHNWITCNRSVTGGI